MTISRGSGEVAAQEKLCAEADHDESEQDDDPARANLLSNLRTELCAHEGAGADGNRRDPHNVVQCGVAYDTDDGTHHQNERGRRDGDLSGESQEEDHHRHVNHAASDSEDGREKTDAEGKNDAERLIEFSVFDVEVFGTCGRTLAAALPEHETAQEGERYAERHREAGAGEVFRDVAPRKSTGNGRKRKRNRRAEHYAALTNVGKRSRNGVQKHAEETRADHLLHRLEGGAVRRHHRQHEKGHHDETAADAEERPDDADADADAEKFAEIDEFKHVSGQKETEAAREFHAETAILG